MASGLTWLDNSREDQQRMRELLKLFSETESRDELGIGQVRDAFSDLLFPGTSVTQTRARYLLIVPWCYQEVQRRGLRGDRLSSQVDRNERRVIDALLRGGETDGVVGMRAGVGVRALPSAIYASALLRYGIRIGDEDSLTSFGRPTEADELTDRATGMWQPTLPTAPPGFPSEVEGGLRLSPDEARWLRERILTTAPNTLLAHLLDPRQQPATDSSAPWEDPAALSAPEPAASLLRHAQRFSVAIHGAVLLYNLLIGQRYEAAGLTEIEEPVAEYREWLDHWAGSVPDLSGWDRGDMWSRLIAYNPRISANLTARRFIDRWLDAVIAGRARDVITDPVLVNLVAERERLVKRGQSRLINDKLLRAWSGASGSRLLVFRWRQVRRIVADIHDGCATDLPEAARARA